MSRNCTSTYGCRKGRHTCFDRELAPFNEPPPVAAIASAESNKVSVNKQKIKTYYRFRAISKAGSFLIMARWAVCSVLCARAYIYMYIFTIIQRRKRSVGRQVSPKIKKYTCGEIWSRCFHCLCWWWNQWRGSGKHATLAHAAATTIAGGPIRFRRRSRPKPPTGKTWQAATYGVTRWFKNTIN